VFRLLSALLSGAHASAYTAGAAPGDGEKEFVYVERIRSGETTHRIPAPEKQCYNLELADMFGEVIRVENRSGHTADLYGAVDCRTGHLVKSLKDGESWDVDAEVVSVEFG
jgi:hypothetical protein